MNGKKLLTIALKVIVIVIIGYLIYDNYGLITNKIEYLYTKYLQPDLKQNLVDNAYSRKYDYDYVKINKNTTINNKEEAKNAIYTFLDAGWDKYIIKCNPDYLTCTDDIKSMVENNSYLTDISNFVHPFNTFNKINTTFSSTGKITLIRKNKYNDEQIKMINEKVDKIYKENYDSNKSIEENIKIFHDYIINNTKYDSSNISGDSNKSSSTAYGVLFDGIGICSGYTDTMALFLDKMNVKNYRVSSSSHVWNLVYVNNSWKHLDLTWDDPINSDGSNTLSEKFFLIDTATLKAQTNTEHVFDESIYIEAK